MADEAGARSWLQNLPAILAALAALLTAVAGLVAAFSGFFSKPSTSTTAASHPAAAVQDCIPGYEWREAYRGDHVCVTADIHMRTMQDNELAGSRRSPQGGAYGPDSCMSGYVWRDAFDGDHVCVTPDTRDQAKRDNEQAALRIKK